MVNWYPQDKKELSKLIDSYLQKNFEYNQEIHGIVVPHAGYGFSGKIAGKVFSLLKNKDFEKAIVFGPSHQIGFYGIAKLPFIKTPFGKVEIFNFDIPEIPRLEYEHSIDNQIPFLQKLDIKKILPLVIGNLNFKDVEEISKEILKKIGNKTVLVFSTDLSHFLNYETAKEKDTKTIKAIENLDKTYFLKEENSACGIFPLLILINLCKLKNWRPKLIEYKNSGDIIGDKNSVVGYAGFVF